MVLSRRMRKRRGTCPPWDRVQNWMGKWGTTSALLFLLLLSQGCAEGGLPPADPIDHLGKQYRCRCLYRSNTLMSDDRITTGLTVCLPKELVDQYGEEQARKIHCEQRVCPSIHLTIEEGLEDWGVGGYA